MLIILICCFASRGSSQQFSLLAVAFWHGKLHFLSPIGGLGQDPIFWHGKIYWSDGPFPALLLMPFVGLFLLFHIFFYQGYMMWPIILAVFYFIYMLARRISYTKEDSLILAFGFCLGSVFIGVSIVSSSWFFAQVVTTFLLFWSLYEFYGRRRWWLIGAICGCILLTRVTALPIILFFLLELWQVKRKSKKTSTYVWLCLPVGVAVCLYSLYNYFRFQNPLNAGVMHQLIYQNSAESRSLGIFSIIHIPTNFYYAVLSGPIAVLRDHTSWTLRFPYIANNVYGMSIFFTSPYLLYLFTQKWSSYDRHMRNLLIAIAASCLLVFSYYGVGLLQFGYRYALDFLPPLFLVFMTIYKRHHARITPGMRLLLLGAGVLNFYLLWPFIFPGS